MRDDFSVLKLDPPEGWKDAYSPTACLSSRDIRDILTAILMQGCAVVKVAGCDSVQLVSWSNAARPAARQQHSLLTRQPAVPAQSYEGSLRALPQGPLPKHSAAGAMSASCKGAVSKYAAVMPTTVQSA